MRLQGITNIKAPRAKVWAFLNDPQSVANCAPGVESVEVITPDQKFRVVASIGFGTVKARFTGDVEFVEREAPTRAKIKGHATAPGSAADALAEMGLSDGPDGSTDLNWSADVTVLGTLAGLASRMMGSVTQKLAGEFFNAMKKKIEA